MTESVQMSAFAETIMKQKYAHTKKDGEKETWENIAYRVGTNVMKAVNAPKPLVESAVRVIGQRKFMPGGRYLSNSGRPLHQVQNCLLLRAEDSREGWSDLMHKACMALMTGAGIGIVYSDIRAEGKPIRKTGGVASGPIALMQAINEIGRGVRQGGDRRSAIWAGLHWNHADVMKFIGMKNWIPEVRAMKAKDYNFPANMDGTNISVILDDAFFKAYHDEKHKMHVHAQSVYWATIRQMLKTAEPGFSIDCGPNSGENLRNACVVGDTEVLTDRGYLRIEDLVDQPTTIWNGFEWSTVVPRVTGYDREVVTVHLSSGASLTCTREHDFWLATDYKGGKEIVKADKLRPGDKLIKHDFPVIDGVPEYAYTQVTVVDVEESGMAKVVYCFTEEKRHLGCFNGVVTGQCTEITSYDDSDICNLGSLNLAQIDTLDEFKATLDIGIAFLLAGTVYSDVPYARVDQVRTKNRRLGLGLMGLHEWLLKRGKRYGPDAELTTWLEAYAKSTEIAGHYADEWEISKPVKTRAIAPTGTIGIVAETTTGMEPIFCAAMKRRYMKGEAVCYQYILDPTAKRLVDSGVNPDIIEDAYTLAEDVERRVAFQAYLQKYVDHSISSTINIPAWGSEANNDSKVRDFGVMLMKYLPDLRGVTAYPDGARSGQPLTPVKWATAVKHIGEVFVEGADICDITKGGSCG